MIRRSLTLALATVAAMTSACSTLESYPAEWHEARDVVHVYGSVPTRQIRVPTKGEPLTLIDVVLDCATEASDLTRITIHRGTAPSALSVEINFSEMIKTGRTHNNFCLQGGDVVVIPD